MYDLVIRGATVIDGLGHDPRRADVAIAGGGPRTLRDPIGVHGVFVNGTLVFDGENYARLDKGPGRVLDRFLLATAAPVAPAAK